MSQFHSIGTSGMAIFDRPIESVIGGIVVDLASAPLAPGQHRLEIDAAIGGIEVFVPRYVQLTVEGGAAIGGQDIHDGMPIWLRATNKLKDWLGLSNRIPAAAPPAPAEPIAVHLVVNGGVGGLDIYRI
jgi:hypothetical protein